METESKNKYIPLQDLDVYQESRELSRMVWVCYERMTWQQKKIIGDQFIESTDSVGANIAEGYGRYHFLDRARFYYNARGSLTEACHWMDLLLERKMVSADENVMFTTTARSVGARLQNFITVQYRSRSKQ
jgi:four helix bundle protein